jgi:Ca2+-binding EF-hand superfamily protein
MNRTHLAWGAAALALTGLAGTAIAQRAAGGMHDPFGNATITRADAMAKAGEMFDRMDANRDGKIDKADRDARMGESFDRMDTNHDGKLDKAEFIAAHNRSPRDRMGGMKMGDGPAGPGMDHPGAGPMMAMRMLRGMDANGDKAITRAEFMDGMARQFDSADTNHDGSLTPEERRAAMRAQMGGMRRHGGKAGMSHAGAGHGMGEMPDMPPPPPGK